MAFKCKQTPFQERKSDVYVSNCNYLLSVPITGLLFVTGSFQLLILPKAAKYHIIILEELWFGTAVVFLFGGIP